MSRRDDWSSMINQQLLAILRCPLDPSNTRVILDGERFVCERCALRFRVRDDLPNLIAEEAELPAGCTHLSQLPCQREPRT